MNNLTVSQTPDITMTSLELVDYINSQRADFAAKLEHSDFLKKVIQVLGVDAGKFSSVYLGGNGQKRPCYVFPKREACLMAMSYSYDLQAKVFDRMTALEVQAPAPAFNPATLSRMDILAMAMDSEKGRVEAETKSAALTLVVEQQAPKVEALDRLAASHGSLCITDAAKELKLTRTKLYAFLEKNRWVYKRALSDIWLGYDAKRNAGLLEHVRIEYERTKGMIANKPQVRITKKGLVKLAMLLNEAANDGGMVAA